MTDIDWAAECQHLRLLLAQCRSEATIGMTKTRQNNPALLRHWQNIRGYAKEGLAGPQPPITPAFFREPDPLEGRQP